MQPGGFPELSQRFGAATNGNSARAIPATTAIDIAAIATGRSTFRSPP
jgi:hypothetical protein